MTSHATSLALFDATLHKTDRWLVHLMGLLPADDRHVASLALRATLHALRDRLTVDEVAQLGAQLPMLIRGFYYEGWDPTGKPLKIRHREQFLNHKQKVDRPVKEAQSHAAEDQKRRELIDARNEADALAYSVEKILNEHRERVPAADRSRIESAIQEVRQAAERDDVSAIKRSIEAIQQMSHALAQTVYAQAQHTQGARWVRVLRMLQRAK